MKIKLLCLVLLCFSWMGVYAENHDGNTYATPERLFHISRSVNKNLVCYDVNLKDGKLDKEDPIKVYWVNREEEPGKTNGLNLIQKKMAYGYKLVSSTADASICSLTAYPSRKLTLTKYKSNYVCLIDINNEKAILESLYVSASPRNSMHVLYVEIRGYSLETGLFITERVKP